jgi:hypothetical protein
VVPPGRARLPPSRRIQSWEGEAACTEVEEWQSVYELKGQSKTGKMLEVEITNDGKFLD